MILSPATSPDSGQRFRFKGLGMKKLSVDLESFSEETSGSRLRGGLRLSYYRHFSLRNYWQMREAQELVASLDQEELEMAADVELAENFDVIQEMDFLEDLEVIENLDSLET